MRETLKFETNVPTEVALAYDPPGRPVEGRYGDQVLFTLADDRVMYVPPIVGDQIEKLGIRREQPFLICKAEVKQGTRKSIQWKVGLVNGSGPAPAAGVPHALASAPAPTVTPQAAVASSPQPQVNTPAPEKPLCAAPEQLSLMAAMMLTSLSAAVDVVHMAEQYALGKGLTVRFGNEDIRAVALTLYIGSNRGGVR